MLSVCIVGAVYVYLLNVLDKLLHFDVMFVYNKVFSSKNSVKLMC